MKMRITCLANLGYRCPLRGARCWNIQRWSNGNDLNSYGGASCISSSLLVTVSIHMAPNPVPVILRFTVYVRTLPY